MNDRAFFGPNGDLFIPIDGSKPAPDMPGHFLSQRKVAHTNPITGAHGVHDARFINLTAYIDWKQPTMLNPGKRRERI
jgi:hypothetical protein